MYENNPFINCTYQINYSEISPEIWDQFLYVHAEEIQLTICHIMASSEEKLELRFLIPIIHTLPDGKSALTIQCGGILLDPLYKVHKT